MASLYLGRRIGPAGFARPVALKVVHAHLGRDPQFVRMFLDEALLCARIRHPNVVHVEELGEYEGAYYLAMEYVEGASLEDIIERLCALGEHLPARYAVSIACALLEGLYATHTLTGDHGEPLHVVHRDVSPSNTLLDRAGHVKLIDFGVAKARGRAVETSAGTLKGKYAYMSPEQAYGRELDHRSDIYSLGVMLWEMLTMRPLFVADTDLALLDLVRTPVVPPLTSLAPDLPAALSEVLGMALAPNREDRPSTARELRKMLQAALPEARSVDATEIGAAVERLFGPAPRLGETSTGPLALGSTVATPATPQPVEQPSQPASTQAGREPRSSRRSLWIALVVSGVLVALLAAFWLHEMEPVTSKAAMPPERAAATPPPPPPAVPVPSMAAPPHVEEPAPSPAPVAAPESTPVREHAPRKHSHRAQPATTAPAPEPEAPTQRTKEMHGVPIVEKPAF